jgi:hypothetical protein
LTDHHALLSKVIHTIHQLDAPPARADEVIEQDRPFPQLAHRVISLLRSKLVALGTKRKSAELCTERTYKYAT